MRANTGQALAAEMNVLAAAMVDGDAAKAAAAGLAADDFTHPENRALFEAVRALVADGETVDLVSLLGRAEGHPAVQAAGGIDYLLGLRAGFASPALIGAYIAAVRECGSNNRITDGLARALQGPDPVLPAVEKLIERERGRRAGPRSELTTMEQIEAFVARLADPEGSVRIFTGMPMLDALVGGLEPGSVSCLAARPSAGKTALALNWLVAAVRAGHKAQFFSLEMGVGKILGRLASIVSNVDNERINRLNVPAEQLNALAIALVDLAGGDRLLIYEDARSIAAIREAIARERPAVAFVDFLQFVIEENRTESENYRLASIVREFKRLARVYGCHICFLSQVGRSGDGKPPTLRDLYGSGAIEQGSDTVVLLDRPSLYDRTAVASAARLYVGKNKDGECGAVKVEFDGRRQRFKEVC